MVVGIPGILCRPSKGCRIDCERKGLVQVMYNMMVGRQFQQCEPLISRKGQGSSDIPKNLWRPLTVWVWYDSGMWPGFHSKKEGYVSPKMVTNPPFPTGNTSTFMVDDPASYVSLLWGVTWNSTIGGVFTCYPPGNGYISHLGKRKIIFKYALSGGYVNSLEGIPFPKKAFFRFHVSFRGCW